MPLRDHFHSPVNDKHRWDAVHGGWPMEIVRTLFDILPAGFVAEPKIYHSTPFEVDVSMIEDDDRPQLDFGAGGGTALLQATAPTHGLRQGVLSERDGALKHRNDVPPGDRRRGSSVG